MKIITYFSSCDFNEFTYYLNKQLREEFLGNGTDRNIFSLTNEFSKNLQGAKIDFASEGTWFETTLQRFTNQRTSLSFDNHLNVAFELLEWDDPKLEFVELGLANG